MQGATHRLAKSLIDKLVLLQLGLSGEFRGNNDRRVMIVVAREIGDLDRRAGNALLIRRSISDDGKGMALVFLVLVFVQGDFGHGKNQSHGTRSRSSACHVSWQPALMGRRQIR